MTNSVHDAISVITTLSKSGIGTTPDERVKQHLAQREMDARARISAANAKPVLKDSHKIRAARQFKQSAKTRYEKTLEHYRNTQRRLAAVQESKRTVIDRVFKRQEENASVNELPPNR